MDTTRKRQIAWVRSILGETGWNQSELARRAGISHATLSKFFNDRLNQMRLETATVDKLLAVSPVPHYEARGAKLPGGFSGHEASPLEDDETDPVTSRAVEALRHGSNARRAWTIHSRALENVGFLPGDVVICDSSIPPREGDVVCARILDLAGGFETAFRLYHKPFLLAASGDRALLAPVLIDDRVEICGVVDGLFRPRSARLAS